MARRRIINKTLFQAPQPPPLPADALLDLESGEDPQEQMALLQVLSISASIRLLVVILCCVSDLLLFGVSERFRFVNTATGQMHHAGAFYSPRLLVWPGVDLVQPRHDRRFSILLL